jgi:putative ABC transport system permease protein
MLALKLAFRNLIGAGLRTWLNVAILSFAYVMIIFYNGMIDGWNHQGQRDTREWETGQGQLWHPAYDRYDPYTFAKSHAPINKKAQQLIESGKITPILIRQGSIFPQGRVQNVIIKGISPRQNILKLPTQALDTASNPYAALIGKRMAKAAKLKQGDFVLLRWRDKNGTFDAHEIQIVSIFDCDVPSADNGQIYMSINTLQEMTNLKNEATLFVVDKTYDGGNLDQWKFKSDSWLLSDFTAIIQAKKGGGVVLEGLLLLLALLAIFDTQVLSIFKRQKEIGTYIALGLTRWQVVGIFTVEGGAHSILAALLGAAYGIPFLLYLNTTGINFGAPDMGITMAQVIFPYYSLQLIVTTILIVVIAATIVSYVPAKKISKMRPADALKGKLQ